MTEQAPDETPDKAKCLAPVLSLIDSHCHLDFPVFDENRTSLIDDCVNQGIKRFIVPGVTADTWPRLQNISAQFPSLYPAYGLHPYFINEHQLEHIDALKKFIQTHSAIAVGEIGLDYYLPDFNQEMKKTQQMFFDAQLAVANESHLPVILHVRKAHDDVLMHLQKSNVVGGAVHAFNGSLQQAHRYIDLGFKLGFGGALTFDKATHLRKLVSQLPLDALLLETDSPDMLPARYSLQSNAPENNTPLTVLAVLKAIEGIRPESAAEIATQTTNNAIRVFTLA